MVGAGIVGSAIALELARHGARTTLLDREAPAAQASGGAAGMLAPWSEAEGPGAFLELAVAGAAAWPEHAARLHEESGIDPELERSGLLRLAADVTEAAALRRRLGWLRAQGADAEWVDAVDLAGLEPATGEWAGAVLHRGDGHVHSARSCAAQVEAARRRGVQVRSGAEVVGVDGAALRLADGTAVPTAAVVVAAGAWSGRVLAALGVPAVPVEPVRGQLAVHRGVAALPRRILFAGRRGYALAKRDGTLIVGATEEEAGFSHDATAEAGHHLRITGMRLVPALAAAPAAADWVGLRPRCPDGLPALGIVDPGGAGAPAVYVATGHHRNGVLLAPVTAVGMAAIVLDGVGPPGWEQFRPDRFGRAAQTQAGE